MPEYKERGFGILPPEIPADQRQLDELRRRNNPHAEPVGDYTGRCRHCGSRDLWTDNLAYGCNSCHGLLGTN